MVRWVLAFREGEGLKGHTNGELKLHCVGGSGFSVQHAPLDGRC